MDGKCLNCETSFEYYESNSNGKYCSNKCQQNFRKKEIINDWKSKKYDGIVSKNSVASISGTIRDYLIEQSNYKCVECGWGNPNPFTNKIPLHIHHIDGNALNCEEQNLKVLCPNCHSLTDNYGKLNKSSKTKKKKIVYS